MYFLYLDEAGTSAPEPHSIFAGVLIKSNYWRAVEFEIQRVIDAHAPANVRPDFIFHGKDVFNGGRLVDRSTWALEDRLAFFREFVSIPFRLRCPVAIGKVCRWAPSNFAPKVATELEMQNVMAFIACVTHADKCIRDLAPARQTGVVVAEDNPPMRRLINAGFKALHTSGLRNIPPEHLMNKLREPLNLGAESFVELVHFAPKNSSPMLQLADACAFAMRRFLAKQSYGEQLFLAMTGRSNVDRYDFQLWLDSPSSGTCYRHKGARVYSTRTSWKQA